MATAAQRRLSRLVSHLTEEEGEDEKSSSALQVQKVGSKEDTLSVTGSVFFFCLFRIVFVMYGSQTTALVNHSRFPLEMALYKRKHSPK